MAAVEAARRARAAEQRRARLLEQRDEIAAVVAARRRKHLPVALTLPAIPAAASEVAVLEAQNDLLDAALTVAEGRLLALERAERDEALRLRLAIARGSATAASIRAEAAAHAAEAAERERSQREVRTSSQLPDGGAQAVRVDRDALLDDLVARIPLRASDAERAEIEVAVLKAAVASDVEFESHRVEVAARLRALARAIAVREEMAHRARGLLVGLDELDGADVDAARSLLLRVVQEETPLLDHDVASINATIERARDRAKRTYVADRIAAAFGDAGYDVELGFATAILTGDEVYLASRTSAEHAVALQMTTGKFDFRVVRASGPATKAKDTAVEVEFCKDVGRISAGLHTDGVTLELLSHELPGAVPVAVVPAAATELARARRRSSAGHERTRQRQR